MPRRKPPLLELRQLSESLDRNRQILPERAPRQGWLRTVREAIGMSTVQLARRLGVAQPTVVRAEQRERRGTLSLANFRKFADSLDCDVAYVLIPRTSLIGFVERQAEAVAVAQAAAVAQSLEIEWEVVPPPSALATVDAERERLLAERPPELWDLAP